MSRKLTGKFITVSFARKLIGLPGRGKSARNSCIGGKLRGTRPANRQEAIQNFTNAAKSCK